ncbi:hypothetical protein E2562_023006 [Oryza meyeriana var. granulata]|uniref:Uncharacterized protein n=1 Tax=Oryza meyeriana var. granulata TaxID=110450 RepID=A0A6G1EYK1_9ORYZ|nr:hypothetical protein E2562_023006 [Oryza meyeriana var. granulata]
MTTTASTNPRTIRRDTTSTDHPPPDPMDTHDNTGKGVKSASPSTLLPPPSTELMRITNNKLPFHLVFKTYERVFRSKSKEATSQQGA